MAAKKQKNNKTSKYATAQDGLGFRVFRATFFGLVMCAFGGYIRMIRKQLSGCRLLGFGRQLASPSCT